MVQLLHHRWICQDLASEGHRYEEAGQTVYEGSCTLVLRFVVMTILAEVYESLKKDLNHRIRYCYVLDSYFTLHRYQY